MNGYGNAYVMNQTFNILKETLYEKSIKPKSFFQLRKSDSRRRFHLILFKTNKTRQPMNCLSLRVCKHPKFCIKAMDLVCHKKKYEGDIPTNITAIKYFEKAKIFHMVKNLYLLLLEDL
jgi:hypothetical protein